MAGGPYSLHTGSAFLQTFRGLPRDDRRSVGRVLSLIQRDPSIDGIHKILLVPDAPFTTYVSPEFYVFYFVDGATIFVIDIERIA